MNTPSALPLHSDEAAHRALREVIDAKRQQLTDGSRPPSGAERERLENDVQALERLIHEVLAPRLDTRPSQLLYEHHGCLTSWTGTPTGGSVSS